MWCFSICEHPIGCAKRIFVKHLFFIELFVLRWTALLREGAEAAKLSAIFNFQSLISVLLLLICTCTYLRSLVPNIIDRNKEGLLGVFWKCARIGERLSPWISADTMDTELMKLKENLLKEIVALKTQVREAVAKKEAIEAESEAVMEERAESVQRYLELKESEAQES
ncbi:hypothetical protein QR680_015828 [Steinernema hermaphroditum]|uniref:Protein kish-B n=1 Tax=Steinernema hermaphroditum TaxID=289476 RepID=A0AA39LLE4_9BILA|nr:hypothetical protein QR680_015828 [Steinernema hermaphroditum]